MSPAISSVARTPGHNIDPFPRRAFLAGLAKLPLIGGSVALLGKPTAVAEPVSPELLEAYNTWLHYEWRWLAWEMAGDPEHRRRYHYGHLGPEEAEAGRPDIARAMRKTLLFVGSSGSYHGGSDRPDPSSRAALVLSTVGCDWYDKGQRAARWRA